MRKFSLKILGGFFCFFCLSTFLLPACSQPARNNTGLALYYLIVGPWAYLGHSIEEAAEESREAAAKRRAEADARRAENERQKPWQALSKSLCSPAAASFCFDLLYPGYNLNLPEFIAELEGEPKIIQNPKTHTMLGVLANSGISKHRAGELGMSSADSASERLLRAALLRLTLADVLNSAVLYKESDKEYYMVTSKSAISFTYGLPADLNRMKRPLILFDALGRKVSAAEYTPDMLQALARPTHEIRLIHAPIKGLDSKIFNEIILENHRPAVLAGRLLELDQAILAARQNKNIGPEDELVLGMDTELLAWFGPRESFKSMASQAVRHYETAIRSGQWNLAVPALIQAYDLVDSTARQTELVKLFIENVPNQPTPQYDKYIERSLGSKLDKTEGLDADETRRLNLIYSYTKGRDIQPVIWEYLTKEWRADWAAQMTEILEGYKENREIAAMLTKAYQQ